MGEFSVAILCLAGSVFAVSSAMKLRSRRAYMSFRDELGETGLVPGRLLPFTAATLCSVEAVTGAGLLAAAALTAVAASGAAPLAETVLAIAAWLTGVLAAGVASLVRRGSPARCACFGAVTSRPLGRAHPLGGPSRPVCATPAASDRPTANPATKPRQRLMRRYLLVPSVCGLLFGLGLRQRFVVVTVDGDSMWPTLKPGDRVLVRRARLVSIRAGQIVVIEAPGIDGAWATRSRGSPESREWIIKRVAGVPGDPRPADCLPDTAGPLEQHVPARVLVVIGDNPSWSQDSRQWGYFPGERLLGVVVRRIRARSSSTRADGAPVGAWMG